MRFFLVAMLFSLPVSAAYRLYQLKVTQYDPSLKKEVSRIVTSSLDHLQYEHYHSGYKALKVELVDTWYCPGDTSRHKPCTKPKEKKPQARDLATAYDKPKRAPIPLNLQPVIP